MSSNPDYSILLLNLGAPKSISDIRPFLYQLFSDKYIMNFPIPFLQPLFAFIMSRLRSPKVAKHYEQIGGGSPLLEITAKQSKALEKELRTSIDCRVFLGMRYTQPSISLAIKEIHFKSPKQLIALPLYPQYSTATTLSSFMTLRKVLDKVKPDLSVIEIKDWHDFPDYIKCLSLLIREKLNTYPDKDRVHLVFSAHSLPVSLIEKGDPYADQINASVDCILKELSIPNPYHVCYQSKVGPIRWLDPSTEDTIKGIANELNQDILMIPISFVSDHFETDYEIDILYAGQAKAIGIRHFKRTDSLNTHPLFIKALANLVLQYIEGDHLEG